MGYQSFPQLQNNPLRLGISKPILKVKRTRIRADFVVYFYVSPLLISAINFSVLILSSPKLIRSVREILAFSNVIRFGTPPNSINEQSLRKISSGNKIDLNFGAQLQLTIIKTSFHVGIYKNNPDN